MERDFLLAPKIDRPLHSIAIEVCQKHRLTMTELLGPCRLKQFVEARHEAWWRARRETVSSLPAIGKFFNRDHTTVLAAIRKYEEKIGRYSQAPEKLGHFSSGEAA